jgi:hypothetical protein
MNAVNLWLVSLISLESENLNYFKISISEYFSYLIVGISFSMYKTYGASL